LGSDHQVTISRPDLAPAEPSQHVLVLPPPWHPTTRLAQARVVLWNLALAVALVWVIGLIPAGLSYLLDALH
jgi:hypothetical protein